MLTRTDKIDKANTYWENLHQSRSQAAMQDGAKNLQIVCCTGLSQAYNRMIDHFQKISLLRAIRRIGGIAQKHILEIGCGTGRWCEIFLRANAEVTAIDISGKSIEINKAFYPKIDFRQMSAHQLDFSDNQFDAIFSITVLQHVPYSEKKSAIKEISRCLKPGGFAILLEQFRPKDMDTSCYENTITFPYTCQEWKLQFQQHGLTFVWEERLLFLPLVINVFLPLKRFAVRVIGMKNSEAIRNSSRMKMAQGRMDYIVTLCLVPFLWPIEYFFVYVLRAGRWTKQDMFGRHQLHIFRKM